MGKSKSFSIDGRVSFRHDTSEDRIETILDANVGDLTYSLSFWENSRGSRWVDLKSVDKSGKKESLYNGNDISVGLGEFLKYIPLTLRA